MAAEEIDVSVITGDNACDLNSNQSGIGRRDLDIKQEKTQNNSQLASATPFGQQQPSLDWALAIVPLLSDSGEGIMGRDQWPSF